MPRLHRRFARSVCWLTLALAADAQTYSPGQTYFGGSQYNEYRAGDLPIIITAPHGGSLTPAELPNRVPIPGQDVSTTNDANTADLVRRIADVIHERTGRHAHLVINLLSRLKLDPNRELAVAAQGSAAAGAAWQEYHGWITAARQTAQAAHGFSFLVDQHGHGHAIPRLELGYNLGSSTLALSDAELARPRYQWDTYLRTLPLFRPEISLPALLRGPRSLGEFFAARNFPACPSPRDPSPGDPVFFSGGYTTDTHTCFSDNGPGHGVQIEANLAGVRDTAANRQIFAIAVAEAVGQFLFDSYGFVLGTCPVFHAAAPGEDLHAGGPPVGITIARDGFRGAAETLAITFAGTAVRHTDYTAPASVPFAPGQATAVLVVTPAADIGTQGDRTLELTLAPTSLQAAATAPLVIPFGDGRSTAVRVEALRPRVTEGSGPIAFRLRRTPAAQPLTVNLAWSGDAVAGRDYVLATENASRATFPSGQSELQLSLPLVDDATLRPSRSVSLNLLPGAGYVPGAAGASVEIADDDTVPGLALWLPGTIRPGVFRDESEAGRHAAAQPAGRGPRVVAAPGGLGISFDGTDQALQLPRFTVDPSRAFSLAFRFRLPPGATVANQNLVSLGPRGAPGSVHIHLGSATTLRTRLVDTTGPLADSTLDAAGTWTDDTWRHYALVVDAPGGRRVFIDGGLVSSAPGWTGPLNAREQFWLGWRPQNSAAGHLHGALADFRVYQRAITAAEVGALASTADPATTRLTNLSIRTGAGTGDATLIVGFYVGGAGTAGGKSLLLRGVGPTLTTFGVSGALPDPEIELLRDGRRIAANDNWGGADSLAAAFAATGAFAFAAPGSRDAALLLSDIAPGVYSAIVRGVGGSAGIALAEVYEVTSPRVPATAEARLINLSARAVVGTGDNLLIAGFVVSGTGSKRVLIRAIGPTLSAFGVAGVLGHPQLTVFRDGSVIAANDDWGGNVALSTAGASVGAFNLSPTSADAALLLTLNPATYTVQVSGAGGTTGVALVEIYELP